MILCVDPNVRGCGIALFDDTKLVSAQYVKHPNFTGRNYISATLLGNAVFVEVFKTAKKIDLLIIEHPRIYPGMPSKDLNDLIDVANVGSAVNTAMHLNSTAFQTVFPSEWKGNVEKKVMLERIRSKLSTAELKACRFTNKSDNEDLLDAVGIGLWRAGRLNTKSYPGAS